MDTSHQQASYEILIYNNNTAPYQFVVNLIRDVFAIPLYEAEMLAQRIDKAGKWAFGPYPANVAAAMMDAIEHQLQAHQQNLLVEKVDFANPDAATTPECSFCGKAKTAVHLLFSGKCAQICDECIVVKAGVLQEQLPSARIRFSYQLLDWHFGDVAPDKLVKTSRTYPGRVRADLQTAVDALFSRRALRVVGIKPKHSHEQIDLMALWMSGRDAHAIAPLSFEELDVGEAEPKRCQINGLWFMQEGETRYAVILSRESDYYGSFKISIEIGGPQGDTITQISRQIFEEIEKHIRQAQSYRGKVLSLEQAPHYGGSSTGITVHKMVPVSAEQIILPQKTLEELDRTVLRFCAQREKLRRLGLQTKRGILFYGPPGTGKTHTVRYLATQLPEHTTFLVTAEQIGLLPEYFALARLLQPVIFVIEDADLLAKSRESMQSPCEEALLNHLLNEMDGLKEDADILFILSTNKPEVLEEALVSRPGRIDQLIEFPKPDAQCRDRLMQLYGRKLTIQEELISETIRRTEGVSASFIKELMRRLAQYSIEREADGNIERVDVEMALAEMVFEGNSLKRQILGA